MPSPGAWGDQPAAGEPSPDGGPEASSSRTRNGHILPPGRVLRGSPLLLHAPALDLARSARAAAMHRAFSIALIERIQREHQARPVFARVIRQGKLTLFKLAWLLSNWAEDSETLARSRQYLQKGAK